MRLRALAKAADSISLGDVVNSSVRMRGNWGLMPFGTLIGTVTPAAYMRGSREVFNQYEMVGGWRQQSWALCIWQLPVLHHCE